MNIDYDRALVRGRRVLCAVSGGADSMCLLHLLHTDGADVTAAHFEHGIRGEESLRDAAFVADWCREHGIPCIVGHGDVPALAAREGLGLEEAARRARYEFLTRTAAERGCDVIATAHTRDDSAETLIFNLVRGSGAAGLSGIPRQRGNIVRPLLDVSRAQVEAYLTAHAIPHVEDSSNGTDDYTRNRIRRHILPALRQINPRADEALCRAGALIEQDNAWLEQLARAFIDRELRDGSLSLAALRALPVPVSSRVLRRLLPGLGQKHVEQALAFLSGSELAWLDLPGRRLRREQGRLWLDGDEAISLPPRPVPLGQRLMLPEAGLVLEAQLCVFGGEVNDLFTTSFLKCEMMNADLLCTGRRPGDRLRVAGRGCTKSLKALFSEAGFTRAQREGCVVIRDGEGPLLVRGLALAERAVPAVGERAVRLTFTQIENNEEI